MRVLEGELPLLVIGVYGTVICAIYSHGGFALLFAGVALVSVIDIWLAVRR